MFPKLNVGIIKILMVRDQILILIPEFIVKNLSGSNNRYCRLL